MDAISKWCLNNLVWIIGVLVAIALMACAYQNQSAKNEAKHESTHKSVNQ